MVTIAELHIYPISSCRGIRLMGRRFNKGWLLTETGLEHDRQFVIVNSKGKHLSQKEIPKMCQIETAIASDHLMISIPHARQIEIPLFGQSGMLRRRIMVYKKPCWGIDQGELVSRELSKFIGVSCRLMRQPGPYAYVNNPDGMGERFVSFVGEDQILGISEASLEDLNGRLKKPFLMNQFRPNIVFAGCEPYKEDEWHFIQFGPVRLRGGRRCARCSITTIEQITAELGKEPLSTLAKYRREGNDVFFGRYFRSVCAGMLQLGATGKVF